jgi:hypothetical protein
LQISSQVALNDSLNTIIEETLKILSCDRASVFLVDLKANKLWSKVAKSIFNKLIKRRLNNYYPAKSRLGWALCNSWGNN